MKRKLFVASLGAAVAAGASVKRVRAQSMNGMMNMMGGNLDGSADMRTIMQLFRNHGAIRRRVETIEGGVRAITESDDPEVAALLQAHVSSMYRRVEEGKLFTMMSPTLPTMFANARRYRRVLALTPKGVVVTESTTDQALERTIVAHAGEISGFVARGMPAMMD